MTMSDLPSIYEPSQQELTDLLVSWGEPAFRGKQVYRHLYVRMASSCEEMTDLPEGLRRRLDEHFTWGRLKIEKTLTCDKGMTRKTLMSLPDGSPSETVLMIYPDRATVCISSQSGCPMACSFCATGKLGFLHDLTVGDMVQQVMWAERELRTMGADAPKALSGKKEGHWLTNLVFMGMGEPFNNFDAWWQAVERLHDPGGYDMGARSFTVSTVGLVPGIEKLAEKELPVNLAISLHSPINEVREEMMPVNKTYPIEVLVEAARSYTDKTGRRVSFEYVLLQEKNDLPEHAERLAGLLRPGAGRDVLCHVNLIPWNPVPGTPLSRSNRERVQRFQEILQARHVPCTVRVERGVEIAAACGQLAG